MRKIQQVLAMNTDRKTVHDHSTCKLFPAAFLKPTVLVVSSVS